MADEESTRAETTASPEKKAGAETGATETDLVPVAVETAASLVELDDPRAAALTFPMRKAAELWINETGGWMALALLPTLTTVALFTLGSVLGKEFTSFTHRAGDLPLIFSLLATVVVAGGSTVDRLRGEATRTLAGTLLRWGPRALEVGALLMIHQALVHTPWLPPGLVRVTALIWGSAFILQASLLEDRRGPAALVVGYYRAIEALVPIPWRKKRAGLARLLAAAGLSALTIPFAWGLAVAAFTIFNTLLGQGAWSKAVANILLLSGGGLGCVFVTVVATITLAVNRREASLAPVATPETPALPRGASREE